MTFEVNVIQKDINGIEFEIEDTIVHRLELADGFDIDVYGTSVYVDPDHVVIQCTNKGMVVSLEDEYKYHDEVSDILHYMKEQL